MRVTALSRRFFDRFGVEPRIFRAAGRVNLLGEHTDYMGGLCLPMAIDRDVLVAAAQRDDRRCIAISSAFADECRWSLDEPGPGATGSWHDLLRGVSATIERGGPKLAGASLMIDSEIPLGAGLSSSAATALGVGSALLALSQRTLPPLALARAAQAAEHEFVGTRCGLLDQLAIVFGRRDHAALIDCRSDEISLVPMSMQALAFIVCDTRVQHDLSQSGYNACRSHCESGLRSVRTFKPEIATLRDLRSADLHALSGRVPSAALQRVRHVVTENERVLNAIDALAEQDGARLGELMLASHASLRDDYQVSCAELDFVVDESARLPGVFGAKMTGGGFGGSVVLAVEPEAADTVQDELRSAFTERFATSLDLYRVMPSDGLGEVHSKQNSSTI